MHPLAAATSSPAPLPAPAPTPVLTPLLLGALLGTALQVRQPALWPLLVYGAIAVAGAVVLGALWWTQKPHKFIALTAALAGASVLFGVCGLRADHFAAQALNPALEDFLGQDKDDATRLSDSFTRLEAILNQGMIRE